MVSGSESKFAKEGVKEFAGRNQGVTKADTYLRTRKESRETKVLSGGRKEQCPWFSVLQSWCKSDYSTPHLAYASRTRVMNRMRWSAPVSRLLASPGR